MSRRFAASSSLLLIMILVMIPSLITPVGAAPTPQGADTPAGIYRGVSTAVKFDISPPLRSITPLVPQDSKPFEIPERGAGREGALGPQTADAALQTSYGPALIPTPSVSFDGPSNTSSVSPPDPVGDVGPSHYVAMSNLSFQIFNKSGTSVFGPALNNTLWAGFGGDCQTNNAGDPIVLYDQVSDRWMLSQFTSAGPTYYNCVAVSTTSDPTGSYYRWAFSTGGNFPDYPKYGWWPDALYISTREFAGGSTFVGVGAYAIKRSDLISGVPAAQVISFLVAPTGSGANVGDGLLPTDMDGFTPPPAGTPNFFLGSQDDGASYGATLDALNIYKFHVDFATPANSTFTLGSTLPIAAYDTIPAFCSGRACVPQPGTTNKIDHLGYRQRPLHRAAYRNFGTHESIVTNQSVEASTTMSGIRWWEIRSPNATPVIYQEGTYAPGIADGIHRWMGSIAQDSAGNMALGYSASDGTSTYPSLRYTGRLSTDALGTMPQGEASIINGTGSQTGSNRWGDYTSMNVDPVDDCTFWYVNEYVPATSSIGWRLRIGAFKFNECGTADFTIAATPASQEICVGANAPYTVNIGSVSGYNSPVTLSASGNPGTAGFSTNPVTPPGSSTMTISGAAAGSYNFNVVGTAAGPNVHQAAVGLTVQAAAPGAPTLTAPANGATNVPATPTFTWSAATGASTYSIQVATDAGFSNVVASASGLTGTSWSGASLSTNTLYYWRVQATNACGVGSYSSVFSFTTVAAPGDCAAGTVPNILYQYGFEAGESGWTHSAASGTDSWAISTANPHSGASHYRGLDPASVSDQRLVSPAVALPTGQNPVVLKFWHVPNLENSGTTACYDGGILEASTDAGATWTQVPNASLLLGGYTGAVSTSFGNPLGGLQAWCNGSAYTNVVADVSTYAGQTAQFRFRLGSDSSVSDVGWDIDDVTVQSCQPSQPTATPTATAVPPTATPTPTVPPTGVELSSLNTSAGTSNLWLPLALALVLLAVVGTALRRRTAR